MEKEKKQVDLSKLSFEELRDMAKKYYMLYRSIMDYIHTKELEELSEERKKWKKEKETAR